MMSELEAWREWKARCALARCANRTRAELQRFAAQRFLFYFRRYRNRTNLDKKNLPNLSPRDCWHLFETQTAVKRNRHGKRYKQWLFDRLPNAPDTLRTLQSGAALLMRDVVRNLIARECPPARMISMQVPVGRDDAHTLTLEDLLPADADPAGEAADREMEALAWEAAGPIEAELHRIERTALLAGELGLPFSHPEVLSAAGCSKTQLYRRYRQCLERIASTVTARFPGEERGALTLLTAKTVAALKKRVLFSENTRPRLKTLQPLLYGTAETFSQGAYRFALEPEQVA